MKGLARSSKMEHRRRKRARIVLLAAEGMVPDPRAISKGDARHISSDRTGVLPSPRAEKRSSQRATQRTDMADDMTKLNEFQALNNEELDSVSRGVQVHRRHALTTQTCLVM